MVADGLGDVVLELPLALERLLGNVGVGSERSVRKYDQRLADVAGDQVIPILEAERRLIDQRWRQKRIQGQIGQLQMVDSEVAVGQIAGAVRLIVQAVVSL